MGFPRVFLRFSEVFFSLPGPSAIVSLAKGLIVRLAAPRRSLGFKRRGFNGKAKEITKGTN